MAPFIPHSDVIVEHSNGGLHVELSHPLPPNKGVITFKDSTGAALLQRFPPPAQATIRSGAVRWPCLIFLDGAAHMLRRLPVRMGVQSKIPDRLQVSRLKSALGAAIGANASDSVALVAVHMPPAGSSLPLQLHMEHSSFTEERLRHLFAQDTRQLQLSHSWGADGIPVRRTIDLPASLFGHAPGQLRAPSVGQPQLVRLVVYEDQPPGQALAKLLCHGFVSLWGVYSSTAAASLIFGGELPGAFVGRQLLHAQVGCPRPGANYLRLVVSRRPGNQQQAATAAAPAAA